MNRVALPSWLGRRVSRPACCHSVPGGDSGGHDACASARPGAEHFRRRPWGRPHRWRASLEAEAGLSFLLTPRPQRLFSHVVAGSAQHSTQGDACMHTHTNTYTVYTQCTQHTHLHTHMHARTCTCTHLRSPRQLCRHCRSISFDGLAIGCIYLLKVLQTPPRVGGGCSSQPSRSSILASQAPPWGGLLLPLLSCWAAPFEGSGPIIFSAQPQFFFNKSVQKWPNWCLGGIWAFLGGFQVLIFYI